MIIAHKTCLFNLWRYLGDYDFKRISRGSILQRNWEYLWKENNNMMNDCWFLKWLHAIEFYSL